MDCANYNEHAQYYLGLFFKSKCMYKKALEYFEKSKKAINHSYFEIGLISLKIKNEPSEIIPYFEEFLTKTSNDIHYLISENKNNELDDIIILLYLKKKDFHNLLKFTNDSKLKNNNYLNGNKEFFEFLNSNEYIKSINFNINDYKYYFREEEFEKFENCYNNILNIDIENEEIFNIFEELKLSEDFLFNLSKDNLKTNYFYYYLSLKYLHEPSIELLNLNSENYLLGLIFEKRNDIQKSLEYYNKGIQDSICLNKLEKIKNPISYFYLGEYYSSKNPILSINYYYDSILKEHSFKKISKTKLIETNHYYSKFKLGLYYFQEKKNIKNSLNYFNEYFSKKINQSELKKDSKLLFDIGYKFYKDNENIGIFFFYYYYILEKNIEISKLDENYFIDIIKNQNNNLKDIKEKAKFILKKFTSKKAINFLKSTVELNIDLPISAYFIN